MAEKLEPEILAQHLRKPQGKTGIQVAENMNQGNRWICLNTYGLIELKPAMSILEIGMGNGKFIPTLFEKEKNITYTGVDYSSTMIESATLMNKELCDNSSVQFINASIEDIPVPSSSVDVICTTNTIYFWPQPQKNIKELFRILKPGGKVIIAYRDKTFMSSLKVTEYGFTKFTQSEVDQLLINAGFKQVHSKVIVEKPILYEGEEIILEGVFSIGQK